jgi:hypothetical protein
MFKKAIVYLFVLRWPSVLSNIKFKFKTLLIVGAAGMLLHIIGKFTMWKLKSFLLFSLLTAPHCQFRGVGQSMKTRIYIYGILYFKLNGIGLATQKLVCFSNSFEERLLPLEKDI